jgi:hypothetical protein
MMNSGARGQCLLSPAGKKPPRRGRGGSSQVNNLPHILAPNGVRIPLGEVPRLFGRFSLVYFYLYCTLRKSSSFIVRFI